MAYPDHAAIRRALIAQAACNPLPLLATIEAYCREARAAGTFDPGTPAPLHVRLYLGQLSYLLGCSLGPSMADLQEADRLVTAGEAV